MTSKELAVIKSDPFSLMDNLDDRQIIAEMKGAVLKEWVYSIEIGGKKTEGLSKAGIDACTSELSRKRGEVLREIDFQLIQNPDDVIATVKAGRFAVSQDGREVMLETVFGVKRQARQEEVFDRDADGEKLYDDDGRPIKHLKDDPFVIEKALMKAARNAKKRLIPMEIQQMVLAQAREQGRIKKLSDTGQQGQQETNAPLCPVHKKPMSNGKFGWYCKTKVGDGWCKAKPVDSATGEIHPEAPKPSNPAPVAGKAADTADKQPEGTTVVSTGQADIFSESPKTVENPVLMRQQSIMTLCTGKGLTWTAENMANHLGRGGVDWNALTQPETDLVLLWLNGKAPSAFKPVSAKKG